MKSFLKGLFTIFFLLLAWHFSSGTVWASNNASCISYSLPAGGGTVVSGQQYISSVTFQNTGTQNWVYTPGQPYGYYLGSGKPGYNASYSVQPYGGGQDNSDWGTSRVFLSSSNASYNAGTNTYTVVPGAQVTFTFYSKAPNVSGQVQYYWNWTMLQDSVQWFGGTCSASVTVVPNPWNDAGCTGGNNLTLGSQPPSSSPYYYDCFPGGVNNGVGNMTNAVVGSIYSDNVAFSSGEIGVGDQFSGTNIGVAFWNSGRTQWCSGSSCAYRLGQALVCGGGTCADGSKDYDWGWGGRQYLTQVINPCVWGYGNCVADFQAGINTPVLVAPSTPGKYHFSWRMLQELVQWFGPTVDYEFTVFNKSHLYISPQTTPVGQSVTVTATTDPACSLNPKISDWGGGINAASCVGVAGSGCNTTNPYDSNTCKFIWSCSTSTPGSNFQANFTAATGNTYYGKPRNYTSPPGNPNPSCSANATYNVNAILSVSCYPSPSSATTVQQVTWYSNVSGGSGSYTYSWLGAASGTGANSGPFVYSTPGTQNASLTVTSSDGQQKTVACSALTVTPAAYTVSGYVKNNADLTQGVAGVVVSVFDGTNGNTYYATTDVNGHYAVNINQGDSYAVRIASSNIPTGYITTPYTTTVGWTWNYCVNPVPGTNPWGDTPVGSASYECQVSGSGSDCSAMSYGGDPANQTGRCNFAINPTLSCSLTSPTSGKGFTNTTQFTWTATSGAGNSGNYWYSWSIPGSSNANPFGQGLSSEAVTYPSPGNYNASVQLTNLTYGTYPIQACTGQAEVQPQAIFSCAPSQPTVKAGTPMTWNAFVANGQPGATYNYTFSNPSENYSGVSSTVQQSSPISYSTAGTQAETVTIQSSDGQVGVPTCSVNVESNSYLQTSGDTHTNGN